MEDPRKEEVNEETAQAEAEDAARDQEASEAAAEDQAEETAGENTAEEEAPGEKEPEVKKGFFGKKKDKKDKKDTQIEELTDRVQRQLAEFDNFRKRTEKEKAAMYEIGAKSVIEKILPVVDNFERGFMGITEEQSQDPFVSGMEKIYRQLMTTLEALEVKPIEAVGQPFDPNFHNAVMHVEDESLGENVVAEELQKGYMYRDSVVRHSMVKVAN